MTQNYLAQELLLSSTSIEYKLDQYDHLPVFLFIIDTCLSEKELGHLKVLLLQTIVTIPSNSFVGFITYGSLVFLHELACAETPKSYAFNGKKIYSCSEIQKMLNIYPNSQVSHNELIIPFNEAEQMLNSLIDQLEIDSFPVEKGSRHSRCSGIALNIGITLLETLFPNQFSSILLFTNGPITKGYGSMASLARNDFIRQSNDILLNKAEKSIEAKKYFTELGFRCNEHHITVNYLSASFEESGFYEIETLISITGGFAFTCESWNDDSLKLSLLKYFSDIIPTSGSHVNITVACTHPLKVCGLLGNGIELPKIGDFYSQTNIGKGGTNQWSISSLMSSTSLSYVFDFKKEISMPSTLFIQIISKYRQIQTGHLILRVTTHPIYITNSIDTMLNGLNQFAALSLLARISIYKSTIEKPDQVNQFLSSSMSTFYKLVSLKSPYPITCDLVMILIYYLNRSSLFNTFNFTPDQTKSQMYSFLQANIPSSILMFAPSLTKFVLGYEPKKVRLSEEALVEDCILVLDTFFRVLIWYGKTIASWRDQHIQDLPEHEDFRNLLEKSYNYASEIVSNRFPSPQLITCDQDSSLARYLQTKVNI